MPPRYQAPKGTLDILPPGDGGADVDSAAFAALVAAFAERAEQAGFGLIVGPMFEDLAVYERVGATTDIVRKEMYDFTDKGDRHLALRPDSTPSVLRAFIEHRPTLPWKVWYLAPHFRYDRPQFGRYRQHHSLGVEVLGVEDPDLDAELIALADGFVRSVLEPVGAEPAVLQVNSMGDEVCRPAYRDALVDFLAPRSAELCDEHRDHWRDNPMRLLDCKREECRAVAAAAPRLLDQLCEPCAAHFERVRAGLESAKVDYTLETRLVRGQDYYTRTTFEFVHAIGADLAVGGGGRYDGFVEALGGPATPGVGFGLGVERLLLAAASTGGSTIGGSSAVDVFVIDTTEGQAHALGLVLALRAARVSADRGYDGRSFKAQMKSALRARARLALVVEADGWTVRTLAESGGVPEPVDPTIAAALAHLLAKLQT